MDRVHFYRHKSQITGQTFVHLYKAPNILYMAPEYKNLNVISLLDLRKWAWSKKGHIKI